ncbi:MAG: membrane protein insertion efficiency factor YidD [Bacilli bacterium]|nr:membrane protein insertion efficiency factor YidD [Bacilli bacterium]MBN2696378.1 membrane protein insertion efficiency factor YidD [Bacilli bacterium]
MMLVRIMKKWIIRMIRGYQQHTAGRTPTCRYKPTCSNYAIDAYENYNVFYATILTVWRILRCNPFSKGGYDPIPKYKKELKRQLKEDSEKNRIKG